MIERIFRKKNRIEEHFECLIWSKSYLQQWWRTDLRPILVMIVMLYSLIIHLHLQFMIFS